MYQLSEETLNAVLQYLGSKPYTEVAGLIAAIQKAEKVEEKKKDDKEALEGEIV
jgi:hypothetical protein